MLIRRLDGIAVLKNLYFLVLIFLIFLANHKKYNKFALQ